MVLWALTRHTAPSLTRRPTGAQAPIVGHVVAHGRLPGGCVPGFRRSELKAAFMIRRGTPFEP